MFTAQAGMAFISQRSVWLPDLCAGKIEMGGNLDYAGARDSAITKVNRCYFKKNLTIKQYEPRNHSGNALATMDSVWKDKK